MFDLFREADDGVFEDGGSVHLKVEVFEVRARAGLGPRHARAAAGTLDRFKLGRITRETEAVQAVAAGLGGEDGGAGAITKKKCGAMILGVRDAREKFSGDHDQVFGGAGQNEGATDFEGVEPTGAGGVQVEGEDAGNAEFLGEGAGHGGYGLIGDQRGHDNAVDLVGGHAGLFQGVLHGDGGEGGGAVAFGGVAALFNAGEVHHLLLRSIREGLEDLAIGANMGGDGVSDTCDANGLSRGVQCTPIHAHEGQAIKLCVSRF